MSFFRQAGRNLVRFGRQLPRQLDVFGRQVSNTAGDIGRGLGQAERFVSKIEKPLKDVPILGGGLKVIESGLGVGKDISQSVQAGGGAIRALGRGDIQGAYKSGQEVAKNLGESFKAGQEVLKAGGEVAGQAAMFL